MWPKIHSNRDPRDTLLKEVRKEFGTYFTLAGQWGGGILRSHPKIAFYGMVSLLLLSMVLSFTVFREQKKVAVLLPQPPSPVVDGFGQILKTSGKIRETITLKSVVDSLTGVKPLTAADSARLLVALDRLQQLSKP